MKYKQIIDHLINTTEALTFSEPVTHVYNPLVYARKPHNLYFNRFGQLGAKIMLLGMNPGPWGMVQTGVPFGEIPAVREWMGIQTAVNKPENEHPKRPIEGFDCTRSEVSGRRLWSWAQKVFGRPEDFFSRFFVVNYCPLVFMESGGRNRTPNNLPAAEKKPLLKACDVALRQTVDLLCPEHVIGVGVFAEQRARAALAGYDLTIGRITHPSPANPRANKGWEKAISKELETMGIG
ncbi:MAG: single-stranded DNA-binding protein, partial [Desulfobacterales bacterium]|nr:single-stranded DNA-binding protein [Desulfobacterales bacterium]